MTNTLNDNDLSRAVEAATIIRELKPDEQRDALNILRGFGLAKGAGVIPPQEPEPPQNNKTA